MKANCTNCGKEFDETEYMQTISILPKKAGKMFAHSKQCPECFSARTAPVKQ
jgi:hypothetical protein